MGYFKDTTLLMENKRNLQYIVINVETRLKFQLCFFYSIVDRLTISMAKVSLSNPEDSMPTFILDTKKGVVLNASIILVGEKMADYEITVCSA